MAHNKVDSVQEVAAYEEAREMLDTFKEANRDLFNSYDMLVEDVNQKMEAADKVVRAAGVSCGPWDLYQFQVKVDAETLFNSLGRDGFLKAGGTMSSKTIYKADKKQVEASVARGEIPQTVADAVLQKSARYKAPKAL